MTDSPHVSRSKPESHRGADGVRRVLFLAMALDGGGVTTHMMTLAQGLMAQGVEVAIASRGAHGEHHLGPAWFEAEGIKFFRVPFPVPVAPLNIPFDALKTTKVLSDVVSEFRPDLLHLHNRSASPYARWIEHKRGIPFVATHHSLSLSSNPFYRHFTFWGDSVLCVSQESARYLMQRFGVNEERITIIPHGIDVQHFRAATAPERAQARAAYGIKDDVFTLALIGNLNAERGEGVLQRKGHDVLLRALAQLRTEGIRPVVLQAGRGDPGPVNVLAERCGVLDQIRALGHQDARRVLWASDVLVLPSNEEESFGLVVIEAMCCGVSVVRSATGGHEEQIQQGVTGFTFPRNDDTALAEILRQLYADTDLRAEVARTGMLFARRQFSQARMVNAVREVYSNTLRLSKRAV